MIGIYYPYLEREGSWEELKYSLRSLERFLDAEYEIWIVGDLPKWIKDVQYIAHQKIERIVASSTFDAVTKLQLYLDDSRTPERFIRMYDDIYFIGPRTLNDLEVTRYLFTYEEICQQEFKSGSTVWRDQVMRTLEAVLRLRSATDDGANGRKGEGAKGCFDFDQQPNEGIMGEIYMTETHCPEVFEKGKMQNIMDLFDPAGYRLLTSSLYFNIYPFDRILKDRKVERALFYGVDNEFSFKTNCTNSLRLRSGNNEFHELVRGKYFLNHNDVGLDNGLKRFIGGMFREKSRWEK